MEKMQKWINTALFMLVAIHGSCYAATSPAEPENPATMAFSKTHVEVVIPEFYLNAKTNLLRDGSIDLDTAEGKQQLLRQLDQGEFSLEWLTHLKASVTIGHFSIAARPWFSASTNLKSGIPELLLAEYDSNKTYEINGTSGEGIAAGSIDFSYGRKVWTKDKKSLGAGLTIHCLQGMAVGKAVINNTTLTYSGSQTDYSFDLDTQAGSIEDDGFSSQSILADFGLFFQNQRWNAGLVLKNMGPDWNWTGVKHKVNHYTGTITNGAEGPDVTEGGSTTSSEETINLSTQIPMLIHLYGELDLTKHWQCKFGIQQGMDDAWGVTTLPLFHAGFDWKPISFIGLTSNIYSQDSELGIDTTLHIKTALLLINLGVGWAGDVNPANANSLSFAFSTGLRF